MYMIFIGINDILDNFTVDGATPAEVMEKTVPQVISAIFKAVQVSSRTLPNLISHFRNYRP